MNIAIVVGQFPKLSETFILSQITGLIDLGHDVDVFSFWNSNEEKVHSDIIRYNLLSRVTYFDQLTDSFVIRMVKVIKVILRYFISYPKEIIKCLNYKEYEGKYYALNNLLRLEPFLRKRYDVIHCHFGPNGLMLLFLKDIFGNKVKYITSFHGYDLKKYTSRFGRDCYKELFLKADLLTANSDYTKNFLESLGCCGSKITKLPVGLNVEKFKFLERKLENRLNILTIARLVEKKGLQYSIKGVASIIEKYPNLNLNYRIVGDGPLRNELKILINKLGLEQKIFLFGNANDKEMLEILNEAHIFILTSITADDGDEEGQGLVLQEAQASGLPVIASNHNGFPDSIINEKSGFLVPEKDVDAIGEMLEYLIKNFEIWSKMGKTGRKFVEENFDIKKLNMRLVELYKSNLRQKAD